ncbi:MAG TPA: YfhO family protein [Candidatus Edwardsbacteria bacterium]|nr:YfhO family protein [Candidatus Edwardsbacteria bacterium]
MKKKKHHAPAAAEPRPQPLDGATPFDRAWLAIGLMALAVVAVFGRALFTGQMVYGSDFMAGGYMTRAYIVSAIRASGAAPLWYSSIYGGVPLTSVGSIAGDYWYPLLWPLYQLALAPERIALLGYCLHLLLAGAGTYLFLRSRRIGGAAALIAGTAYMFTGSVVSLVFAGHDAKIIVSALLPWLLLFIGRTVDTRKLLWALAAGLVVGLALMSPHVQMSYYLLLAGLLYAAALIYARFTAQRSWRAVAVSAGLGAVILAVGFGIYAVQALTLQQYLAQSPRGRSRGYDYAASYSMPPEETIDAVWPEFSGLVDNATDQSPTRWYWGRRDLKLHTEYVGVVPVLLALLGLLYSRRKRLKLFLALLAAAALIVAWGGFTPLYHLVYSLVPLMSKFRSPAMIFNTAAFAAAGLAALGVQALVDGAPGRRLTAGLGIAAGGLLLFGVVFSAAKDGITQLLEAFAAKGWGAQALWNSYPEMVTGYWIAFVLLLAGALLVWLLARRKLPLTWWTAAAALVIFLELWRVDSHFIKLVPPPDQYFAKDEVVSALQKDHGLYRVWPLQVHQSGNYLTLFGLQTVGGEHPNPLRRYNEFVGAAEGRTLPDFHNLVQYPRFLDILGVKYLLMQSPVNHPDFVLSDSCYGGQVRIYRNTKALPRAWLAGSCEVIAADDRILARMQRPDFDPARTVVLERQPAGFSGDAGRAAKPAGTDSAVIEQYQPNVVAVAVRTAAPALLVLTDNFYPAWHAYVDGQLAECYRADYTFRAVAVPAGSHRVEFRYESRVYRSGLLISVLSLIAACAGIAALAFREIAVRKAVPRAS